MAKFPHMFCIRNEETGICLAQRATPADTFCRRLHGLLGKRSLEKGKDGLLLFPCCAVHSWGMNFSIDLVFISRTMKVLCTIPSFPPARFSPRVKESHYVLELPQGMIAATGTTCGHRLIISSPGENCCV